MESNRSNKPTDRDGLSIVDVLVNEYDWISCDLGYARSARKKSGLTHNVCGFYDISSGLATFCSSKVERRKKKKIPLAELFPLGTLVEMYDVPSIRWIHNRNVHEKFGTGISENLTGVFRVFSMPSPWQVLIESADRSYYLIRCSVLAAYLEKIKYVKYVDPPGDPRLNAVSSALNLIKYSNLANYCNNNDLAVGYTAGFSDAVSAIENMLSMAKTEINGQKFSEIFESLQNTISRKQIEEAFVRINWYDVEVALQHQNVKIKHR